MPNIFAFAPLAVGWIAWLLLATYVVTVEGICAVSDTASGCDTRWDNYVDVEVVP